MLFQTAHWKPDGIVSGNGLVSKRCQAIAWTNDVSVHWHIYASPGLDG